MKIKQINLLNFGSYEGSNTISFEDCNEQKRVVVIGGKNGAGKTTLFTALQIGLYGHYAFGFRSAGKHYLKEVYNLINNRVRLDENAKSSVEISFEQITDTDRVIFRVRREWTWSEGAISEKLLVWRDEAALNEDELANFQNYLIHLIPPDLLKLYFFDGEKVADYFLGNKEVNIRDALMVLSGNDTFDILFDNVRRVLKMSEDQHGDAAKDYLTAKAAVDDLSKRIDFTRSEIQDLTTSLEDNVATRNQITQAYASRGGVTLDEWTTLHGELREEEEKRERLSAQKKVLATEVLPFFIACDLVDEIMPRLRDEKSFAAYKSMQEMITTSSFADMLCGTASELGCNEPEAAGVLILNRVSAFFRDARWDNFTTLFGLSEDEESQVLTTLNRIDSVDRDVFAEFQKKIDTSLEKTKTIRTKIQSSDIEHFEEYIREVSHLEAEHKNIALRIEHTTAKLAELQEDLVVLESKMRSAKKAFEDQLKKQSVSALSGRVLLLLEDLQKDLYSKLMLRVEKDLNTKFGQLIRKKNFFSQIRVDSSFNIHILRNQPVARADLLAMLKGNSFVTMQKALGCYAVEDLTSMFIVSTPLDLRKRLQSVNAPEFILPVEVDKERFSSGEKQIFVMSLYWAMMRQSKNDLPYVIDTPFARIDTEHRANITDHFFKQLNGQLLVLSTDEEISGEHMASMEDQIAKVYMLEYGQDKCTHIYDNKYFEV